MYRLKLLGGARLEAGDESLPRPGIHQRHRLALLAMLAVQQRDVARDKLIAYLWPERETRAARNLLNVSTYVLRTTLGDEALLSTSEGLRLNRDLMGSDVEEFERAIRAGALATAVDLYGGPFLDGFFIAEAREFELWADAQRGRLAGMYAKVLETLARDAEAAGDSMTAVGWWRLAVSHDRFDSRLTMRLMLALEAAGNRAGALALARAHSELLLREFGAEPISELMVLAERLRNHRTAVT